MDCYVNKNVLKNIYDYIPLINQSEVITGKSQTETLMY